MTPEPFGVIRKDGMIFVEASADAAFRKALMDGVPPTLRPKMVEALSAQVIPNTRRAQREARRHFGKEADAIFADAAELAGYLHRFIEDHYQLRGLIDWLTITGYGNDYRMIKVFAEWARMSISPAVLQRNEILDDLPMIKADGHSALPITPLPKFNG